MDAYQLAYEYVRHTARCIFLTGKAGTGKTTFLRRLRMECPKQMAVVAPTGVAAINAEGVTIHSLFQLPPQMFLPTDEARRKLFAEMQMRAQKQRVLRNLELLVIDEVSMVRADLLDTIDAVLRHFKHRPRVPFGGVQVLLIGDLFQLSPVAREEEWQMLRAYYEGPYFFQARVFTELHPVYIELDHVFRQTNTAFIDILNQVRNNCLSDSALRMLNSRYLPAFDPGQADGHYITLSTHNHKVDAINRREMQRLDAPEHTFRAKIKDTFPQSMYPMDEVLVLKEGARVMFIKNDSSPEKQYYNGKIGVVSALTDDSIIVECPEDSADGGRRGSRRQQGDGMECNSPTRIEVHTETWENLRYTSSAGSDTVQTEVVGSFTHYPLRLAWAVTIHKAQGLTFDHVMIDAEDAFAAGQVYVALSRCRSLEGIVLLTPIPERALTNAREVVTFTAQQPTLQATEQQLHGAQDEYLVVLLCALYDFREYIDRVTSLRTSIGKMGTVEGDYQTYCATIIGALHGIQVIAERFQLQIRSILYKGDAELLKTRLQAANTYFAPKHKQLLGLIADCPLHSSDAGDASALKQAITDLYADLARVMYVQGKIGQAPTVNEYFGFRQKTVVPPLTLNIYAAPHKKRTPKAASPRPSATAFESLSLLYKGNTIHDIAALRRLTPRTVARHLASFVAKGVLSPSDFAPEDAEMMNTLF